MQVVRALGFKDLEALAHPGNEAGMHTANPDQRKKAGQARTNRALANREVPPRYLTLKPALQTKHTVGRKDIYIHIYIYNASSDLHAINQMCVPTLFRQVTQAEPRSCVPELDRFIGLLLLTYLDCFCLPASCCWEKRKSEVRHLNFFTRRDPLSQLISSLAVRRLFVDFFALVTGLFPAVLRLFKHKNNDEQCALQLK